ncbi:MAG TPA: hypothetical protein PLR74_05990 [Agriterribacter sp.]|nr:hypothetical protein [Agriterribacter sp.]
MRAPVKNYNKFAVKDLDALTPGISRTTFIAAPGARTDTVLVGQPACFKELNRQLKATPLQVWKNKLKLKVIENAPLGAP